MLDLSYELGCGVPPVHLHLSCELGCGVPPAHPHLSCELGCSVPPAHPSLGQLRYVQLVHVLIHRHELA